MKHSCNGAARHQKRLKLKSLAAHTSYRASPLPPESRADAFTGLHHHRNRPPCQEMRTDLSSRVTGFLMVGCDMDNEGIAKRLRTTLFGFPVLRRLMTNPSWKEKSSSQTRQPRLKHNRQMSPHIPPFSSLALPGWSESTLAPDFYGQQTQVTTSDEFFPVFWAFTFKPMEKDLYILQAQGTVHSQLFLQTRRTSLTFSSSLIQNIP